MNLPYIIALTGQSGCGKSTVADYYRRQGIPVLDADKIAAQVLQQNRQCLAELAAAFGKDILDEAGALRRRLLADRAFAMPGGQQQLTEITHPYIIQALLDTIQQEETGSQTVMVDGAVIVGEPFAAYCDKILVVDAPRTAQIARLVLRDGISEEQAARRLDAQKSKRILYDAADALICNDGDLIQLEKMAERALREVLPVDDKKEKA